MADYISTLNGSQMDAALLDMAEHNSEAYAVGERNGVAVDIGDVTYHNNARYYAQQAQSIVPASVTEAVRWDVAQTALTDAQREQARENIKATSHNYNLLDNGWFLVNSRNATTGNGNDSYSVDRWKVYSEGWYGTWTVTSNGMSLAATSSQLAMSQFVNNVDFLNGKVLTASAMLSDGTIYSGTITRTSGTVQDFYNSGGLRFYFAANNRFSIGATANSTKVIRAVKLELGSFSTLVNDTPPDYGEELTRCIYSTADPTDTYANNGFGRTNPNLLDNWWFGNPVNQRGLTTYSGSGQLNTIDRWILFNGSGENSLSVQSGYISVKSDANGFGQFVENSVGAALNGKTVTCSVMFNDGSITSATGIYSNSSLVSLGNGFYIGLNGGKQTIVSYLTGTTAKNIKAMKVELGTISTLANDVPPNYAEELRKCQYYFKRFSPTAYTALWSGIAVNQTTAAVFVDGEMRSGVNPTVSISGTGYLAQSTSMKIITSGSAYYTKQGTRLLLVTSATLTVNAPLDVYTSANQNFVVDISAELN